ncbi:MAG: prolyl oligopeptidase family serine peptidase [Candidatus Kapabacteria bacterium]|nr:prolyl oligopeptidase family serine peptidase [Candidatus Kapabacteria bacterium]
MKLKINRTKLIYLLSILLVLAFSNSLAKKAMTFEDAMKFKQIKSPAISNDGKWLIYSIKYERGDGEVIIQGIDTNVKYNIPRGSKPIISENSQWVAMTVLPKEIDVENKDKDKNKNGLAIVNLSSGKIINIDDVKGFKLSNDSKWLIYNISSTDTKKNPDKEQAIPNPSNMILRNLETETEINIPDVYNYSIDSASLALAYCIYDTKGKRNGLYIIDLKKNSLPVKIDGDEKSIYSDLTWHNRNGLLAFISALENEEGEPDSCHLNIWDLNQQRLTKAIVPETYPAEWYLPFSNDLSWSEDSKRLFFGLKPLKEKIQNEKDEKYTDSNFYDIKTILKKAEVDIWHWNDPRIKTNEKNVWKNEKDFVYKSVYFLETNRFIKLADEEVPNIIVNDNPDFAIGYNDRKYLKDLTWDGTYFDLYAVSLKVGTRKLLATRNEEMAHLSPAGKFIVFYRNKNWFLYDCNLDSTINLTARINNPFYDEDNDLPKEPGSYGIAGWTERDDAVLIYDKYDIWKFYTGRGYGYLNQTAAEGRFNEISFRIKNFDPNRRYYNVTENLLVTGYFEKLKKVGIFTFDLTTLGLDKIFDDEKKYTLIAKAKNTGQVIYHRESYDEYPDVWIADSSFKKYKKLTDIVPEINDYYWGKTELISWKSYDGDTLDGFFIKPGNFNPSKKYPVIVYFYEKFSQLMYDFNEPYIGHRICFPIYAAEDYILFLPDVKYKIGNPGMSAINSILSGLRRLFRFDFVDSNSVGIIGHSWSGYQTSYMITQTNLFKAAVAGAPVGNMTSAYSGIRLESGLARQFQYEKQQSRIGGNLWDSLDSYIRNSPIFQAPNIKTPLLIMFGDEDQAVPWQQGIELYLAMRRLNKNCIFLQYRDEPHWPNKFHNRLDYAIKTKEFFDHYLLKKPAPNWMTEGVKYKGD